MKKKLLLLIMYMCICTACYPTGENNIKRNNIQTLEELNTSELENIEFDFCNNSKHTVNYPTLKAQWKKTSSISNVIEQIFINVEDNKQYKLKKNLPGCYIETENNYTLYEFDSSGYLAYDTGLISYIKNYNKIENIGYLEVIDMVDTVCSPEYMKRYFSSNNTDNTEIDAIIAKSDEIIQMLSISVNQTPDVYKIDKDSLQNIPYLIAENYNDFTVDDEAYLIQYRYEFEGLPLPYFMSYSVAKDTFGINPVISFIYSNQGLEYFAAELIEVIEENETIKICTFIEAANSVKKHIENIYSENNEKIKVTGGELCYLSEIDYDSFSITLKPVWIFTKEIITENKQTYFDEIIIDAQNAQLYS